MRQAEFIPPEFMTRSRNMRSIQEKLLADAKLIPLLARAPGSDPWGNDVYI